jgi:hypothetical protein
MAQIAKFKGKCEEQKNFIYKISSTNADSFTKVTLSMSFAPSQVPESSELL